MDVKDFKKRVKGLSELDVTSDEDHVLLRCDENNITLDYVKKILLDPDADLVRIVGDRPDVYKVYYRLSRCRELKVIVDFHVHKTLNIRTVKILDSRFGLGSVKRQRF